MKSYYSIPQNFQSFEAFELTLLDDASRLIESIPDEFADENKLRCHELARAIGDFFDIPVTDGKYGSIEHSWCWTRKHQSGDSPRNILDVYAISRLPMVQLVDYGSFGCWAIPNRDLYKCYPFPRNDIKFEIVNALIAIWKTSKV
jgi:hypothetical protein